MTTPATIVLTDDAGRQWTVPYWHFAKWHEAEKLHDALILEHADAALRLTPQLAPKVDGVYYSTSTTDYMGNIVAAFHVDEDFKSWADWENFLDDTVPERNE